MYPKLSSRILLVAALYVLTFLAPILRGAEPEEEPRYKPRYTLWAFTATGADSNDFDINDYSTDHDHAVIYIRNLKNKKKVWQAEVAFPRPMAFQLRMAPDKKHAVLFFTDFGRTQSIDWLHLPEGKPKAKWIDIEELEKQALKACGKVEPGWVAKFPSWFWCYFLDWDAQGRCRIKWEYSVSHEGADDTTNTGIAIVTIDRDGKPRLRLDSFLKDLTDEQMKKVRYGKHVTLKK